jgi:DNA polymerase-3 subunit delta'
MPLKRVVAQQRARMLIERMVQENRLPHALLFWGPAGTGKSVAAIELARWLNCRTGIAGPCDVCDSCKQFRLLEHPHLLYLLPLPGRALADAESGELTDAGAAELTEILRRKGELLYCSTDFPGGQNILIGQIRALLQWAGMKSFENYPRIALIEKADQLREEAANALLKLLEEPPQDFVLILTAQAQEDVLPTLRSRCQAVEFEPLRTETIENFLRALGSLEEAEIMRIAQLSSGNLSRALQFATQAAETTRLYDFAINVVRHSLGRNPLDFDPLLETWNRLDGGSQQLVLEIIASWLRDAAFIQQCGKEAYPRVIHRERLEWLEKFVANCRQADFLQAVSCVEDTRKKLQRNVLAPMALLTLSRDLYRAIYQRPPQ